MESSEGKGIARRAWEAYESAIEPAVKPLAQRVAAPIALDLMGFWLVWHLHGGFEGLRDLGMSRASIYRRIKLFRSAYGVHPDEFSLPGVKIDVREYRRTKVPLAPESQD